MTLAEAKDVLKMNKDYGQFAVRPDREWYRYKNSWVLDWFDSQLTVSDDGQVTYYIPKSICY